MIRTFLHGLGVAFSHPRLVALCWAWHVLLSLPAAIPVWRWLLDGTAYSPEADSGLAGMNIALLSDLLHYDRSDVPRLLQAPVLAGAVLALLGGPLLTGGVLHVIGPDRPRPFLAAFLAGAGRTYWRLLRTAILTRGAMLLTLGALFGILIPFGERFDDSGGELQYFGYVGLLILSTIVVIWFWMAVSDYASIRMVHDDRRSAILSSGVGVWLVLRHLFSVAGYWLLAGGVFAVLVAVYVGFRNVIPADTLLLIGVMVLAQQVFLLLRTTLRVGLLATEQAHYVRLRPPPPPSSFELTPPPPLSSGVEPTDADLPLVM
jgi:hypothetical protein